MTEQLESNPPVLVKPPISYSKQLRRMSVRELCVELSQFVPGTRRNRKRESQPDLLSVAYAAALATLLDRYEAGRMHYVR